MCRDERGENQEWCNAESKTKTFQDEEEQAPRARSSVRTGAGQMPQLPRNEAASPGLYPLRVLQGPPGTRRKVTDVARSFAGVDLSELTGLENAKKYFFEGHRPLGLEVLHRGLSRLPGEAPGGRKGE